jgi:hypothetical protein
MTTHADEEADEDNLGLLDIQSVVFTGAIIERQRDPVSSEWKYVIRGETLDGRTAEVVAKLGVGGSLYIVTVYAD